LTAPLELPDGDRRALGEAALSWVLEYFARTGNAPLYPAISAAGLSALVDEPLPRAAQDPQRVLEQFAVLAALGRDNGHPRMFGYVQSSGNFAAAIGDFLASALNQNVTSWRSAPSATTIELRVIEWLKQLVGCETFAGGVLVGGGSAANFMAIAAALRNSTDADLGGRGVAALPAEPVIYASDRVHMSIPKAASLLGLGRRAVRLIASLPAGTLDVETLRVAVAADRAAGRHLVGVVANAGDVNIGAIDPLEALARFCAEQRLWLHVDGAYGGFAAAVPRLSQQFAGMAAADSLTLDPHKWLFAPVDAGCLLVRDGAVLRRTFSQGASYIDVVADPDMSDFAFWDVSPELSRRFRALKLWVALKCHGAEAFTATIDRNVRLARELATAIDDSAEFERLAPVALSIVCFRHVPPRLAGDLSALNDWNQRVMLEVQREGDSYLSNTLIGPAFALRACIVNHRTTTADLSRLLEAVRRAAARL
jgi:glutamate/tyrosine decarboxylase-like PLP-dependent enzyme